MKRFQSFTGLFCSALLLWASVSNAAVESDDPIKLTLHDWTGQLITTQLMGEVLKKSRL